MGYRSEVGYIAKFYVKDAWNVFLIEAKSKPETRLCFEDDSLRVVDDEMEIRFHADGVKWYDEYEDVKCHKALRDLLAEYNERQDEDVCSCEFYRIGESYDDFEEDIVGEPEYDICIRRYIEMPK